MSRRDKVICALFLAGAVGFFATALLDAVPEVRRLDREKRGLEQDVLAMKAREKDLVREIRALRSGDPRAIERRAREDLGMVREGETLFLLPETDDARR
ncbi:FtsB family cell division protein [Deferrisoma palaeochoriense]